MILDKQTTEFDTNCVGEVIDFEIESDAQMFEAISVSLYPDPVKAISREITSNAYDANKENGKEDVPVKIYLPGEFLSIDDSGPGISPERMRKVFCFLGRSTKRDTNDYIGGFGLGAKTPYALSSQFTIETVHEGIHYTYTAYKDENFMPKLMLMDKRETQRPSGTSIKIPVEYSKRWQFREQLRFYTKFWSTPPEFVGYPAEEKLVPSLESKNGQFI